MEEGEAGGNASVAAPAPQVYDLMLQAVGRTPNGKKIAAEKAGVAVTDRGFINVDIQMRTNVPHIFALGDIVGLLPPLTQEGTPTWPIPTPKWPGSDSPKTLALRAGDLGQERSVSLDRIRPHHCKRA